MSDIQFVRCPSCQSVVRANTAYCPSCGLELPILFEYMEEDGFTGGEGGLKRTVGNRVSSIENIRSQPTERQREEEAIQDEDAALLNSLSQNMAPPSHPIQCFLNCYQRILMYQLDYLIEEKGFSPMIRHYGGEVWFKYLSMIRIQRRYAVEDVVDFYRNQKNQAHEMLAKANMLFESATLEKQIRKRKKRRRKMKDQTEEEAEEEDEENELPQVPLLHQIAQLDIEKELSALNITDRMGLQEDWIDKMIAEKSNKIVSDISHGRMKVPSEADLSYNQLMYHSLLVMDEHDYESYFMWSILPTPADTILICYLACMRAREAIMLHELRQWAEDGYFPYRNVCSVLDRDPEWHRLANCTLYFRTNLEYYNMHRPFTVKYSYHRMFRDESIMTTKVLWRKLLFLKRSGLNISIPRIHCESFIHRFCDNHLLLADDHPVRSELIRYTCNLIKLVHQRDDASLNKSATMEFWKCKEEEHLNEKHEHRRQPPEYFIAVYIVIAMKLRFGLCENEAITDRVWTDMIKNMLLQWNARHSQLLARLIEKYQLTETKSQQTTQSKSITPLELLNTMSLGTFEKFLNGEDSNLASNYLTPHNIALAIVELITNTRSYRSDEHDLDDNPYTQVIRELNKENDDLSSDEEKDEDEQDAADKKTLYYYAKRYIKYDTTKKTNIRGKKMGVAETTCSDTTQRVNTRQEPFHIQYSFIVESLMSFLNTDADLHLTVAKVEELVFLFSGLYKEYKETSNKTKVDC